MDLRKNKNVGTLVFPITEDAVLLAMKTCKIGAGFWNGWGGGVEKGETIRQAAFREFVEESRLSANLEDLCYCGKVTFHNQKSDGRGFDVEVHMFLLWKWNGKPRPNSEMVNPTFWPLTHLPYHGMMPSDADWLPLILAGGWIEGETWQKWIEEPGKPTRVILTKPSEIRKAEKLGDID